MDALDVGRDRRDIGAVYFHRMGGGDGMVEESKNPMEVLTDTELMTEFKMAESFIARHAKEMGSRSRPRKFLRMNVERFVAVYFNDQLMETLAKKAEALRAEELFQSLSGTVFSGASVPASRGGKILGKSGRIKRSHASEGSHR